MYKTVRQKVKLKATPKTVYALLADAQKHGAFTGGPVELANEVGGKLSAFGGAITGINVELAPHKRIVQMWRAKDWPKGHYSTATFELAPADGGTALTFTETGVPESKFDDINKGWREHYWDKLKIFLAK